MEMRTVSLAKPLGRAAARLVDSKRLHALDTALLTLLAKRLARALLLEIGQENDGTLPCTATLPSPHLTNSASRQVATTETYAVKGERNRLERQDP